MKWLCVVLMQVDLKGRVVRTLAGDGVKAELDYTGGRTGTSQRLNSPWDVALTPQESPNLGTYPG